MAIPISDDRRGGSPLGVAELLQDGFSAMEAERLIRLKALRRRLLEAEELRRDVCERRLEYARWLYTGGKLIG